MWGSQMWIWGLDVLRSTSWSFSAKPYNNIHLPGMWRILKMELGHVDTASRRHYIVRKTCYIHCRFKLPRLASSGVTLRLDPSKPNVQIQPWQFTCWRWTCFSVVCNLWHCFRSPALGRERRVRLLLVRQCYESVVQCVAECQPEYSKHLDVSGTKHFKCFNRFQVESLVTEFWC